MSTKADELYGVPPLRRGRRELVLVAGGDDALTPEQIEKRCLARLAGLVADAAVWPTDGFGESWRIGDFNILIVETTVAPNAEIYVQFWSEPREAVLWEVSSGHANPALERYVTDAARTRLKQMGFAIGGQVNNFGRTAVVGNRGDAALVAKDVLRIFHEAFGYRGATPLVAKAIRGGRSSRAIVHDRFTVDDTVTLLQQIGYQTRVLRKGKRPAIGGRLGDFEFVVALDVPAKHAGEFQCVDFTTSVGRVAEGSFAAWSEALNRLNGMSRVARGWIDDHGNVCIGASLNLIAGVTEHEVGHTITSWFRTAASLRGGPPRPRLKKGKAPGRRSGEPATDEEDATPQARPVVH